MVLIGEIGLGKSTQLIQFLADSGVVSEGSLLYDKHLTKKDCDDFTGMQSLRRELWPYGCYEDNAINSYQSYSSLQQLYSKLIYMADRCLLQH
uniref:Uncharacterized protein n=1 Tax=Chenopodium quinoa TaxID=63459 RepID=A0A803MNP0_CHEQI